MLTQSGRADFRPTDMQVAANLVTMRADVYRLWMANAVSVDVDVSLRHKSASFLL